jgi:uroporphyrin-III C-methyltransferase
MDGGRDPSEPVAIVTNATRPEQSVLETTLGSAVADAKAATLAPPAIICIGRVTLMRQTLDWMAQMAGEPPRSLDPLGVRASDMRDVS